MFSNLSCLYLEVKSHTVSFTHLEENIIVDYGKTGVPQLTARYCTAVASWRRLKKTIQDSLFSRHFIPETNNLLSK